MKLLALHCSPLERYSFRSINSSVDSYWICEGVGVVKEVHLLSGEVRSVATALQVVEEVQEV